MPSTSSLPGHVEPVFRILGPVTMSGAEGPIRLGGATIKAVLAALLFRSRSRISPADLITMVWESPYGATLDSLYHYIGSLRAALRQTGHDGALEAALPGYRLTVDDSLIDWRAFQRLVGQAHRSLGESDLDHAAGALRRALAMWTGPPIADVGGRLGGVRAQMVEARLAATEQLAAVEAARGEPERVLDLLWAIAHDQPARRRSTALVADALQALGRRDEGRELLMHADSRRAERLDWGPPVRRVRSVSGRDTSRPDGVGPRHRGFAGQLGVHPGTAFDVWSAAALIDCGVAETERVLGALVRGGQLERRDAGRYSLRGPVPQDPDPTAHEAAVRRLLDYYVQATERADRTVSPHRHRAPAEVGNAGREYPDLGNHNGAMDWLRAEEDNLAAVCALAAKSGLEGHAGRLAYNLGGYFFLTKRWAAWQGILDIALDATHRTGDTRAEGTLSNHLGVVALEQGDLETAADRYRRALHLFRAVADRHGEATTLANQAWLHFFAGRYERFLEGMGQALDFYRAERSDRNAAITLRGMALAETELGRSAEAVEHLRDVLGVFLRDGPHLDVAITLNNLGEAHARAGNNRQAIRRHRQALEYAERAQSRYELARAHRRLGHLAATQHRFVDAERHWREALRGFTELGVPAAAGLRSWLDGLGSGPATSG
ncbi:tetratricopeptide repeat protein [Longispora sp. NPDC051575]|uniref:tetratricopeptide repeat protein n=1 Tax=Longispora sp. NPDC051575 TaxID=3154943 RepID=UPI0034406632